MLKAQANHFAHSDKDLRKDMDKRFEALTMRIDRFMIWSFTISLAVGAGVVAAIHYLPAV